MPIYKKCYGTIDRQRLVFIFLEEIHDFLLIVFFLGANFHIVKTKI
jgi:hypothetical protein